MPAGLLITPQRRPVQPPDGHRGLRRDVGALPALRAEAELVEVVGRGGVEGDDALAGPGDFASATWRGGAKGWKGAGLGCFW